jgi:hypothetical protein
VKGNIWKLDPWRSVRTSFGLCNPHPSLGVGVGDKEDLMIKLAFEMESSHEDGHVYSLQRSTRVY